MILEKLRSKADFTENEKAIADYILSNLEDFQNLTSEALAKATLTSKSSVIRFCRKMGTTGYQELKRLVFADVTLENRQDGNVNLPLLSSNSRYFEYMQSLDLSYERLIARMHEQLDHNAVKRVINRLNSMDKIEFYSSGLGNSIAEAVAHRYSTLGIGSTAYSSINEVFLATNASNHKSAAFVISFSGQNPSAIRNAKVLKRYGVHVIGVAGNSSHELKQYCDELIMIPGGEVIPGTEHPAIAFSTNYIFDLIYMGLLVKRYDRQLEIQKSFRYDFYK
jgi:DNA-binding MurR/RpiR family transcriptional regulator